MVLAVLVGKAKIETAYIYRVDGSTKLIYCSNEYDKAPAKPRDFTYVGTANVSSAEIRLCEFE